MPARVRRILTAAGFVVAILCFLLARSADIEAKLTRRDFSEYWAAGQLLLQHQDPYHPTEFLARHGLVVSRALVVRMPPWSLPLMLPLGVLNPFWGWMLWMAFSVASLLVAMNLCWGMFGVEAHRSAFRVAGYTFAPVLGCLAVAQIGLLLLLGVVLFLKLEPERPFLAGVVLLLPFAKPHLLVLFWLVLLLWCIERRRWALASGFAAAVTAATLLALLFDPAAFSHYRALLQRAAIQKEFIPALPGVVRALFFRSRFWVQFVPMAAAAVWTVWYYFAHRAAWDWRDHGSIVMVVSVLTSPYAWLTDEVILLPAMLQAFLWVFAARKNAVWRTRFALAVYILCNGLLLLMIGFQVRLATGLYFWSTLLWYGWYLYGRRRRRFALRLEQAA